MSSTTPGANGAMSKKDRDALIRVVRTRFQLLHQKLHQRREEIKNMVTEQIEADNKAEIKKMETKAKRLKKKAEALEEEGRKLEEEADALGVQSRNYRGGITSISVETRFMPLALGKRVQAAMNVIEEQGGSKNLELTEKELMLVEELLVGGLDSEAGKKFLERIPTAEGLLPMPTPKQIERTAVVDFLRSAIATAYMVMCMVLSLATIVYMVLEIGVS